jgi:hypothetical protein
MRIHIGCQILKSANVWVIYNRREIFRTTMGPQEQWWFIDVDVPQVKGSGKVYVEVDGGKPRWIRGFSYKFVTVADANRLREEAKQLQSAKRNMKAQGKLLEAVAILQCFAPNSEELAFALEELAGWDLGLSPREVAKRKYAGCATQYYEQALEVWTKRSDAANAERCRGLLEAAYERAPWMRVHAAR